jgi:hypothetical protein
VEDLMTIEGIVKGRSIELLEAIPDLEGERVRVTLDPLPSAPLGSARAILEALRKSPPLEPGDIEALERSIEEGKLPLSPPISFD